VNTYKRLNLKNQHHTGFTLVELVMVIVLLSIMSAVALPRFFERSTFQERAAFDDTLNSIRYAKKLAVATNCQTQFQSTANSYQIMTDNICNAGVFTTQVRNPVTNQLGLTDNLSGLAISAVPANITFFPLGNASSDATITVAGRTIQIDAETGFIRAQ
jgi:MSHA pilin protein MshC